jgi:hypothetical protein
MLSYLPLRPQPDLDQPADGLGPGGQFRLSAAPVINHLEERCVSLSGLIIIPISSVTSAENIPRVSDHFFIPTNVILAMSL